MPYPQNFYPTRRLQSQMHITFTFTSSEISYVRLPSANLHLFQSMLYSILPFDIAVRIHDDGFDSDGRKMKLFAMSLPVASARPQFGENTDNLSSAFEAHGLDSDS